MKKVPFKSCRQMHSKIQGVNSSHPSRNNPVSIASRLQKRFRRLKAKRRQHLHSSWLALLEQLQLASQHLASPSAVTTKPQANPAALAPSTPQPFALLSQLAEQAEELQSRLELEEKTVAELQCERDQLVDSLRASSETQEALELSLQQAQVGLDELRANLDLVSEERDRLQVTIQSLQDDSQHRDQLETLQFELEHRDEQITFLTKEIDDLRHSLPGENEGVTKDYIEDLRAQLLESRKETVELRMQAMELADQIAKHQVHDVRGSNESMSWEERKKNLLRELESECFDSEEGAKEKDAVNRILETTQLEIANRDAEIKQLRQLLEEQSNSKDGFAVGAAAIAQLLETDELIQQERLKLKDLQQDWETKARQAEIELSRERARLARERLEMEAFLRTLPKQEEVESTNQRAKSTGGNWLSRLGLKDS